MNPEILPKQDAIGFKKKIKILFRRAIILFCMTAIYTLKIMTQKFYFRTKTTLLKQTAIFSFLCLISVALLAQTPPPKQWDVRFGGSHDEYFFSNKQTTDGGYILGGYSISGISGDKTQNSQGGNDYWIVKTDANGTKQWDIRFGGNNNDYLRSIRQTAENNHW